MDTSTFSDTSSSGSPSPPPQARHSIFGNGVSRTKSDVLKHSITPESGYYTDEPKPGTSAIESGAMASMSPTTPPQGQGPPRMPEYLIVFQNGSHCRLRSVYDRANERYIYNHERDADKPIAMTFVRGKLYTMKDLDSGKFIFVSKAARETRY